MIPCLAVHQHIPNGLLGLDRILSDGTRIPLGPLQLYPLHFLLLLVLDRTLDELERRGGQYSVGLEVGQFLRDCCWRQRPRDLVGVAD